MSPIRSSALKICLVIFCFAAFVHAQEKRLDYKQEQLLKDASYYLDRVEGTLAAIDEKAKPMKAGDPSVQIQDVQTCLSAIANVNQWLTNADNRFKQLPTDHSQVKPEFDRVAPLKTSLAASTEKLKAVEAGLKGVVAKGEGEGYQADFKRLHEIAVMFADPQILQSQTAKAADTIKQMSAAKAERTRIAEKYADLLQQSTPQARDMQSVLNHFDSQFGEFEKSVKVYGAQAYTRMDKDVAELLRLAKEGVQEQRPGYFGATGGVNSQIGSIEQRYTLLTAIAPDSPDTAAARKKIDVARAQVQAMKASLNDAIIAANNLPNDAYNRDDKADLLKQVKAKWADGGNAKPVLKMGINSDDWQRDTRWEWRNSAWHQVDQSKIQAHVLVQGNDKEAHAYYINIIKDHLSSDAITLSFFTDPKEEADVTHRIPLAKLK